MADMPKMKTLTINGITFEVVDETARTDSGKIFVGNYDTTTYAEIKAAHDAGKICFLNDEGLMLPLLNLSDTEAIFVREINGHTDYKITFTSSGGKDFTLVDKNTPLKVTLSGNDTDGYTADKTVAEINEARNAGRDVYMVDGIMTYQLCYLTSALASFSYTQASRTEVAVISVVMMSGLAPVRIQQRIDDSYVKYTEQSLPEEYKRQARLNIGAVMVVTITGDDTNGYTSDKTFAEIQTALDDGQVVLAKIGNVYASFSYLLRETGAVFTATTVNNDSVSVTSYTIMKLIDYKVTISTFDTDAYETPADYVTAGTFAGRVVANASGQDAGTSLLRNSKLVSADTNPTVNGEICWTYK